jgi:hypothetical protein
MPKAAGLTRVSLENRAYPLQRVRHEMAGSSPAMTKLSPQNASSQFLLSRIAELISPTCE